MEKTFQITQPNIDSNRTCLYCAILRSLKNNSVSQKIAENNDTETVNTDFQT